jgi:hypothetical protein
MPRELILLLTFGFCIFAYIREMRRFWVAHSIPLGLNAQQLLIASVRMPGRREGEINGRSAQVV